MTTPFDTSGTETTPPSILEDQFLQDPASLFTQMRAVGAVVPAPFLAGGQQTTWMVTRMEEVVQVLKDSQRFTVNYAAVKGNELARSMEGATDEGFSIIGRSMLSVDGLDHQRLRGLVSQVFTPKYTQRLRPGIQQIADRLLDRVAEQGSMDLLEDYAFPLPINVIGRMMGVSDDNWDVLREGSRALVDGGAVTPDGVALRESKIRAYNDAIVQLVAEKRCHPQDDLISQLILAEEAGDRLSEPELLSMIGLLIVAGHETTANLIGNGTLALLDHPDQLAKLKADLSLVPTAVEELLRLTGPLVITPLLRLVTEDLELGGQHLSRGDMVIPVLISANHDESHFTDAAELDLARRIDRHLAFGYGIHVCLGAPLARLEADIALTTLLRRMPHLRLNVPREAITWHGTRDVRGLTSLPVAF